MISSTVIPRPSRRPIGLIAIGMALAATPAARASGVTLVPPDQSVAQIPVTQFKSTVPATLPATGKHPAVGAVFAIQSYSSSQATPVSPKPGISACLANGQCSNAVGCEASATWPTIAQSIAWWQAQNQAIKGSYAWIVGSRYSHQDAEGWKLTCRQVPQKNCPTTQGWTGNYVWSPSADAWVSHCVYTQKPVCPAGQMGGFQWNGSTWTGGCRTNAIYEVPSYGSVAHCIHCRTYATQISQSTYTCLLNLYVTVWVPMGRGGSRPVTVKAYNANAPHTWNGATVYSLHLTGMAQTYGMQDAGSYTPFLNRCG